MAGSSDPALPAVVRWSEQAVQLKDFASKHNTPSVVKVIKGQYRNIGVAKSVSSELLLHSVVTSNKILAESIKLKDGKRAVPSEQKFSLPLSYQGWFELLSEDGKPIRAIQSVQELLKASPQSCLVRENIKGYIANERGEFLMDRSRTVHAGEQLTLGGDVVVPVPTKVFGFGGKKRLLRCFDINGGSVYLSLDQRGLFSPIAGHSNISGVHNITGLLEKFRLPIMVRLVHGIIPTRLDKGNFTGVFRLVTSYVDETAFVCPLKKDSKMVPVSTREPLKLVVAQNTQEVEDMGEFHACVNRCAKMVASYMNSIHVLVSQPESVLQAKSEANREVIVAKNSNLTQVEEDILFQEIEDIYQYVRDGGKPPAPRPRPSSVISESSTEMSKSNSPKQLTDENLWEEPIYEQLERFKPRDVVKADSGPLVTVGIDQQFKKSDIDEDTDDMADSDEEQVVFDSEEDEVGDPPPPVPPKRFEPGPGGNGEKEADFVRRASTISLNRNSAEMRPESRRHSSHNGSSLSIGMDQSPNSNHLVFQREPTVVPRMPRNFSETHINKVSVNPNGSANTSTRSSPKYVAIARVGEPSRASPWTIHSSSDTSDESSGRHARHVQVSASRRKIQSIYL